MWLELRNFFFSRTMRVLSVCMAVTFALSSDVDPIISRWIDGIRDVSLNDRLMAIEIRNISDLDQNAVRYAIRALAPVIPKLPDGDASMSALRLLVRSDEVLPEPLHAWVKGRSENGSEDERTYANVIISMQAQIKDKKAPEKAIDDAYVAAQARERLDAEIADGHVTVQTLQSICGQSAEYISSKIHDITLRFPVAQGDVPAAIVYLYLCNKSSKKMFPEQEAQIKMCMRDRHNVISEYARKVYERKMAP